MMPTRLIWTFLRHGLLCGQRPRAQRTLAAQRRASIGLGKRRICWPGQRQVGPTTAALATSVAGAAASGWANVGLATIVAQAASVSFRKIGFMMSLPHKAVKSKMDSRLDCGL